MTQPKWTPEPWKVEITTKTKSFGPSQERFVTQFFLKDSCGIPIFNASAKKKSDADRIASCVNALAGIPNPQKFVEAAKNLCEMGSDLILYVKGDDRLNKYALVNMQDAITRFEKALEVSDGK